MEYQGQQQHGHAANRVDEYGNAVAGHGVSGGMGAKSATLAFTGTDGQVQPGREERQARGILHRSGSSSPSSSSSEEDDDMGGRRKKGIKEDDRREEGTHGQDQGEIARTALRR